VEPDEDWTARYALTYHPEPEIELLDIADSQDDAYLAVSGRFWGGDHMANELAVLRWQDNAYEAALITGLSDWCGQPYQWEITEEGHIFLPAAEATDRCEARLALSFQKSNPDHRH
jgi:hypothetical protein